MLEAAGLEFDYLWVGALDAGRWPPVSNPLALVNRRLQRDYVMPDCTPADTLEFAERRLGRLLRAAITVELSWARLEDDKELIPSPLLDTDSCAVAADVDDPGWQSSADLRAAVRGIDFDNAPPVTDDETIAGGAYTVQHMREEPFRAFAHGRLHTREMDRFQPGLTPILRGTIVHAALQQLFCDKPAQADIQQWDRDARQSRIENACWRALGKHRANAGPVLQRLLQLEKQRLMQLLDTFIDSECARESFNVEAVEADAVLRQGPVKLKLRIDRIDRLADTSLLIIDYKAGAKKPFMSSKRNAPANVQLCVYARALNDAVGGLTLFYVDSREIAYVGDGGSIPWGKTDVDSWSGILEEWCHEVDVLLARFASGEVGINSEQKHEDARPLAVLSRIAEIDDAS